MDTKNFKVSANNECKASRVIPDQNAINLAIRSAKKKHFTNKAIIIVRYQWLIKNKFRVPENMDMPNLCLTIQDNKVVRAFYSSVMTHVIKKQKYNIQILN
jgi:hypothetical protein